LEFRATYDRSIKCITIPNKDQAPRGTNRWSKSKLIQSMGTEFSDISVVKYLSFSFLQAQNIAVALINFIGEIIPSVL
jgi:hypothetical protein